MREIADMRDANDYNNKSLRIYSVFYEGVCMQITGVKMMEFVFIVCFINCF